MTDEAYEQWKLIMSRAIGGKISAWGMTKEHVEWWEKKRQQYGDEYDCMKRGKDERPKMD